MQNPTSKDAHARAFAGQTPSRRPAGVSRRPSSGTGRRPMRGPIPFARPTSTAARPAVIALHCSGGTGRQWRRLTQALGPRFELFAPDLIGCGETPHWSGERRFTLAEEARRIVAVIDGRAGPVHLVGHSYGGGVALRVAVERPHRVASLSLYEPTAFHVLKSGPVGSETALAEIRGVAGDVTLAVSAGAYRDATRRFIDYWNGEGAFTALRAEVQDELIRYVPKAALDFKALLDERTPLVAYRRLRAPVRILHGERSPEPALWVARKLAMAMNPGALRLVEGAGHMGPFTHAEQVAQLIASHIVEVEDAAGSGRAGSASLDWAA